MLACFEVTAQTHIEVCAGGTELQIARDLSKLQNAIKEYRCSVLDRGHLSVEIPSRVKSNQRAIR